MAVSPKDLAREIVTFSYNYGLSDIPSRSLRHLYLRYWLGNLGQGTGIQMGCRFLNGRKVFLGDRNVINFGCLLDGRLFKIVTGNDVSIGPRASILSLGHDPRSRTFADRGGDVAIGDWVWIGYEALILPGITIGEGAVVGARSVVTRSIDPYCIVAGNPARVIGERSRDLTYHLDYSPWLI